jgi:hypothetical protein
LGVADLRRADQRAAGIAIALLLGDLAVGIEGLVDLQGRAAALAEHRATNSNRELVARRAWRKSVA